MSRLILTAFAAVAVACATKPTPVTISGDASSRASLAGEWSGISEPIDGEKRQHRLQAVAFGRSGERRRRDDPARLR